MGVVQTLDAFPSDPVTGLRVCHINVVVAGTWCTFLPWASWDFVEPARTFITPAACQEGTNMCCLMRIQEDHAVSNNTANRLRLSIQMHSFSGKYPPV